MAITSSEALAGPGADSTDLGVVVRSQLLYLMLVGLTPFHARRWLPLPCDTNSRLSGRRP